jgi:hypothetical protein
MFPALSRTEARDSARWMDGCPDCVDTGKCCQYHAINGFPFGYGVPLAFSAYLGYRDGIPIVFYRNATDPIPTADRIERAVTILARDRAEARVRFETMGF